MYCALQYNSVLPWRAADAQLLVFLQCCTSLFLDLKHF